MTLTTPAQQFIPKVFGHLHHRLYQIEHLTPILDQRIGLGAKVRPATITLIWQRVAHRHIRGCHTLERRSLVPGLPARAATAAFAQRFGLLGQSIRGRRFAGVVAVLAQLPFQLAHSGAQRMHHYHQTFQLLQLLKLRDDQLVFLRNAQFGQVRQFMHAMKYPPLPFCLQPQYRPE